MEFYADKLGNRRFMRWILLLTFGIPFCYPFRQIISRITHIHVFIIMYSLIWLLMISLLYKSKCLRTTLWIQIIMCYYIAFLLFSPDYDSGLKWIINLSTGIVVAGVLNNYYFKDEFEIWMPLVFGCLICSILFLPNVVSHLPITLTSNFTVRIPFMEGDISIGPNGWATTLALAFMILVCAVCSKSISYILFVFLLLPVAYFMYLTQSRTQIYSVIITIGIYIFICVFNKRRKWYIKVFCFVVLLISIILLIWTIRENILGTSRLGDFNLNGRESIMELGLNTYFDKMNIIQKLFGVGTGGTSMFLYNSTDGNFVYASTDHISAHNIYLDSLISSGIIGTVFVIGYWLRAIWALYFKGKKSVFIIFPLYILISGIGTHAFMSWEYGLIIAFTEIGLYKYCKLNHGVVKLKYYR